MEQKLVTYKVAKALKEAGYLQPITGFGYATKQQTIDFCNFDEGDIFDLDTFPPELDDYVFCPTYLDAWLWLWKDKKLYIDICSDWDATSMSIWGDGGSRPLLIDPIEYSDPEEAIASAIEYLVENNLIK